MNAVKDFYNPTLQKGLNDDFINSISVLSAELHEQLTRQIMDIQLPLEESF